MLFSVIGWTIIHSLWQCLGLLAVLKLSLGLIDLRRSALRYAVASGVLGMAVTAVLVTFVWEWKVFGSAAFFSAAVAGRGGATGPLADGAGVALAGGDWSANGSLWWLTAACPYLTVGWVLGVLFYGARLVLGGVQLRRLRRLRGVADAGMEAILEGLRVRMGILRPVRLLITGRVAEPLAFGVWRAVVVLPLSYLSLVPAGQLEMILAHELAHIRRRDYLINLVQHVFDGLLFFNPFYRMISAAVREEREYCCDDLAAVVAGDKRRMAVALTNLGLVKHRMALGLSAVPGRRSFYRRVSRLIEPKERPVVSVKGVVMGFFVAIILAVGLTQCSRNVLAEGALPSTGDHLRVVLEDNQAGYFEQVFFYNKAGLDHDLFLVMGQDRHRINTAYLDGERVNQAELGGLMQVLKSTRQVPVGVAIRYMAKQRKDEMDVATNEERSGEKMKHPLILPDSIEMKLLSLEKSGKDSALLIKLRMDPVRVQVGSAMEEYSREMRELPLGVEQHELLTRIVTSNAYTAADRGQLNELIRKRQRLETRAVLPDH